MAGKKKKEIQFEAGNLVLIEDTYDGESLILLVKEVLDGKIILTGFIPGRSDSYSWLGKFPDDTIILNEKDQTLEIKLGFKSDRLVINKANVPDIGTIINGKEIVGYASDYTDPYAIQTLVKSKKKTKKKTNHTSIIKADNCDDYESLKFKPEDLIIDPVSGQILRVKKDYNSHSRYITMYDINMEVPFYYGQVSSIKDENYACHKVLGLYQKWDSPEFFFIIKESGKDSKKLSTYWSDSIVYPDIKSHPDANVKLVSLEQCLELFDKKDKVLPKLKSLFVKKKDLIKEDKKEKPTNKEIPETTQAMYRVAGGQVSSKLKSALQKNIGNKQVSQFLQTKTGASLFQYCLGSILNGPLPEQYKEFGSKIGKECRIEGMSVLQDTAVQKLITSISSELNELPLVAPNSIIEVKSQKQKG